MEMELHEGRVDLSQQEWWMRLAVVFVPAVAGIVVLLCIDPIPQDPAYHGFADTRRVLLIPNFGDVVTNLALILIGLRGLFFMLRNSPHRPRQPFREFRERLAYSIFFGGVILTGLGSTWYHLEPNTGSLFWDRLPMAVTFMSLLAIIIGERVGTRMGNSLLWPLLIVGLGSVLYWHLTEILGHGDLRFYGLTQYYPMVAIPLMLLLFPPRYTEGNLFWVVVVFYGAAKICELLDEQIYQAIRLLSGHSLKHLFSAAAVWWVVQILKKRDPLPVERPGPFGTEDAGPFGTEDEARSLK